MLASAFLLPADYADNTDYWHPRAFLSANLTKFMAATLLIPNS